MDKEPGPVLPERIAKQELGIQARIRYVLRRQAFRSLLYRFGDGHGYQLRIANCGFNVAFEIRIP